MLNPELNKARNEHLEEGDIIRQREKAMLFLRKSNFLTFCKEMASEVSGRVVQSDGEDQIEFKPDARWFMKGETSAFIGVIWNVKSLYQGDDFEEYSAKAIFIEANPNGNIIVIGNVVGSTVLNLKDWKDRNPIQKEAFEKAKFQPLTISFLQGPTSPEVN